LAVVFCFFVCLLACSYVGAREAMAAAGDTESSSLGLGLGFGAEPGAELAAEKEGNRDVARLFQRWKNEKLAPELLPFDREVVENISEVVEFVRETLDEERADGQVQEVTDPNYVLRCLETERIQYVLRDYLRVRLWKLEQYPQHYLDPTNLTLLSDAERLFLQQFWELTSFFFEHRLLSAMPEGKTALDSKLDCLDMVRRPNLDRHVNAKILQDLGDVDLPPTISPTQESASQMKPLHLAEGQTYLLRYEIVRKFLMDAEHDGKVELV